MERTWLTRVLHTVQCSPEMSLIYGREPFLRTSFVSSRQFPRRCTCPRSRHSDIAKINVFNFDFPCHNEPFKHLTNKLWGHLVILQHNRATIDSLYYCSNSPTSMLA